MRLIKSLAKAAVALVLAAFFLWLAFFLVFALPNPARVADPLEIIKDAAPRDKPGLAIYRDLIFDLDGARVDAPSLPIGLGAMKGTDFFAEYPFAHLARRATMAVSMTQGKHAMFLEQRNAIYMPTPASVTFDNVFIPQGASLSFATSMMSRLNGGAMPPVTFKVTVKEAGSGAVELFGGTLKPEPEFPYSETDFWYHTIRKFIRIDSGFWNGKWYAHNIDLSRFAGKSVSLTFSADSAGALSHGFIGNPRIFAPDADKKPNVIVAVMDTLRPDFIGANNPEAAGLTPNFDRLAAEGADFVHNRSHGNWSRGSFASIFTGQLTPAFGFADRWSFGREEKAIYNKRGVPSLADEFRKNGYTTISVGNNPFVYDGSGVGLHLGFDQAIDIQREPYDTDFSTAEMIRWVKENNDKRFFMMFTLNTAHSPFRPPLKYFARGFKRDMKLFQNPQAMLFRGVAAYADEYFGKSITALEKLKLLDNTIIVLTADHGVVLYRPGAVKAHPKGEYEWFAATHTHTLYEEESRVPLIVRYPAKIPAGKVYKAPRGLIDIAPSMVELAGIDSKVDWPGVSFAPQATGKGGEVSIDRVITAEGEQVWSMLTAGGFKYIRRGLAMPRIVDTPGGAPRSIREEVFNIIADPHETHDLSGGDPKLMSRLREEFAQKYPAHLHIYKIVARGVDKMKNVSLDISTKGKFIFLDTVPAEGNPNLKMEVKENGGSARTVNLSGIGSVARVFFEVSPPDAPVTIIARDEKGGNLPAGSVRLGPVALPADGEAVTMNAGRENFYMVDTERLVDERATADGVYITLIPFAKWRSDVAEGVKLDPELESLMKKWGYL
ncbi:MAG: sulfatase [Nitrospinae bacterium]|nr:sulfatase [Nitrospinota bacterium]